MHLLSAINNNITEWRDLLGSCEDRPRLPLPYALGGAFIQAGHVLSAIDLYSRADKNNSFPFQSVHYKNELNDALKIVDVAILWGGFALKSILKNALNKRAQKKILYFTYSVSPPRLGLKQQLNSVAVKLLGKSSGGIVVMTSEQESIAKGWFGNSAPIIKLDCGIDTAFYRVASPFSVIPKEHRRTMEELLKLPYVVMPGDELRCNDDAIQFVERTNVRLVRISQYGNKSDLNLMKRNIHERGLSDRIFVFEKISYPFMRFILQHAAAYAGLVDSTWQPAGWTVACEALACGLPVLIYDGLVSRELRSLQLPGEVMRVVPIGDINEFSRQMLEMLESGRTLAVSMQSACFAERWLDFHNTAPDFVKQIEAIAA